MVRGRFDRILRSVASTLAAVFSLALPWALSVPSAQATEETKAAPAAHPAAHVEAAPKSQPSAKAESEKPAPAAQATHAKHHKKKAKKRLASKETSADKPRGQKRAEPTVDHEEPNVAAKHETKKTTPKKPRAGGKKAAASTTTTTPSEHTSATHDKHETVAASIKTEKPVKVEKTEQAKPHDAAVAKKPQAHGRRSKRASTHLPGGKRKVSKKEDVPEKPPCFAPAISIDRNGLENEAFSLVDCKGHVLESAREKLSVMARPWGSPRPTLPSRKKNEKAELRLDKKSKKDKPSADLAKTVALEPDEIAPNVRLLDEGLLSRVETISKHFPGKGISLVSGYRPKSKGSLHQSARALDLRVTGVPNEDLVAFCKTLEDTGCGYYPNSSFVHVDVRNKGTGSVTWIDASGPGETPRYVTQWPPPPDEKPTEGKVDEEPVVTPKATPSSEKVAEVINAAPQEKPVVKEADPKDKGDTGACVPVEKKGNEGAPPLHPARGSAP